MISLLKTENFVQNSSRLEGFNGKSCNLSDMCIYLNNPICFLLIFMYMCVYVCVYVEREREREYCRETLYPLFISVEFYFKQSGRIV